MEITLEKIELVKDRTGVTYKEAKDALEAANGNVVDAIIAIEDTVDEKATKKIGAQGEELIAKMKEAVKKGNVSRILVKKEDEVLINIPLNVGLLGTVVAPWGMIAGVVAAFGFKCKIELTKDDGSIIDLSQKAGVIANDVKEKGSVVVDEVARKGAVVYEDLKANAPEKMVELKEKGVDAYNAFVEKATETWNDIKDKKNEDAEFEVEFIFDEAEAFFDAAEEKVEDVEEKIEEVIK